MNAHLITLLVFLCYQTLDATVITVHNASDFTAQIASKKQPTIIAFSSEWCSSCKHIQEPFEDISNEAEFKHVLFAHVDIDKHSQLSKEHGIIGVPTFIYIDNGVKKDQSIGFQDLTSLKKTLRTVLRTHTARPDLALSNDAIDAQVISSDDTAQSALSGVIVKTEQPQQQSIIEILQSSWQQFKHSINALIERARNYFK